MVKNCLKSCLMILLFITLLHGKKKSEVTNSWGWKIGKTVGLTILGVVCPPAAVVVGLTVGAGELAVSVADADPNERSFVATDGLGRMALGVGVNMIPGMGSVAQLVTSTVLNTGVTAAEHMYEGKDIDKKEMVIQMGKELATGALLMGVSKATTSATSKVKSTTVKSTTQSNTKADAQQNSDSSAKAERALAKFRADQENAAQRQVIKAEKAKATFKMQQDNAKHTNPAKAARAAETFKTQQDNAAQTHAAKADRGATTLKSNLDNAAKTRAARAEHANNNRYRGGKMPAADLQEELNKFHKSETDVDNPYKDGVDFTEDGNPDFRPFCRKSVTLKKFSRVRLRDVARANKAAGYKETPKGYVWHHHQDGHTMQLIPEDLHSSVKYRGGFSRGE